MGKVKIYLDDVRTPVEKDWIVVRNYDQFVSQVMYIGLENIDLISSILVNKISSYSLL
mgnify:CR=1 FL=1